MSRFSYHIPILGYHRIGRARNDHVPTVSAQTFERQLTLLARWKYRIIDLSDVVASLEGRRHLPRRSAVITFDDGYEETYSVAWSILKRFGFSATVFVMPAEVGLKGFATWDQLAEMADNGVTVGSHTMHHRYLPLVNDAFLEEELAGSKRAIEERLGRPALFISYPIGGYTERAQEVVRQAGYLAACTTNRGTSFAMEDRYALRRIKITERDRHPFLFFVKVSGYYDMFRKLNSPAQERT